MKVIAGLGNPGKEYELTRHNIGFIVVAHFANRLKISVKKKKNNFIYAQTRYNDEQIIVLKPQTFMNLSGKAIEKFLSFTKISVTDLIVIHDDMDFDFGIIKIKFGGGGGGHKGLESIITEIKSDNFIRIRIGIGRSKINAEDYVLSHFTRVQLKALNKEIIDKAANAIFYILDHGVIKAMNEFN